MGIKFYSRGAAQEVTGSRHYLDYHGKKIQIDCGAYQGKRQESDERNRAIAKDISIESLEAVILTHAHFDHSGMLPVLIKNGYNGNIYATPATRDLASLIMMDSAKIQAKDVEYLKYRAQKRGKLFTGDVIYDENDAVQATDQFLTVGYKRPVLITPEIKLTFYDAGHILGSSLVVLDIKDTNGKDIRFAATGDLGRKNKPIIRDPEIIPNPDYLVIESTYGDRLHENKDDAEKRLAEIIRVTAKRGGRIIIPAFAIERTQELIYHLHLLTDRKEIPDNIPIYVDSPMATNATSIFRVHPGCYDAETHEAFIKHHKNPFGFNALRYTTSVEDSKRINDIKGPVIIISADGMCEAGRITHHLTQAIEKPENTILIVGFMAHQTLGRKIKEKHKTVKIFGEPYDLKAQVECIDSFSAHADYEEIKEYMSQLDLERLKRVFLVHGESESQDNLKKELKSIGVKDVKIVKYGEEYEIE
ncbi:MAG: MBL fold metallo-hydrolase [Spirochaetes bacterium]|nr:MBL fold metallo-hydrolase [Spirochaetota bacterium]